MKKRLELIALAALAVTASSGEPTDTLRNVSLEEVTVTSTRATSRTPIAYSDLSRSEIERENYGKDVPLLMQMLPSVTTSSDAGTGIGYTGIHVRGTDPTRINVTVNGIPLNDSESAQLYWVNVGDIASSLQSIQLQRGVGTSTNGAGSFGATLNMLSENVGGDPYYMLDLGGGSYGTNKQTFRFSSGLLGGHWGLQGRVSHIASDGYIERANTRLYSYFVQGCYLSDRTVLKFITFAGKEKTYMAWDYASRAQMEKYGRRYNPCGEYIDADGNRAYYPNQTDNYHQQHYQLLWNQRLSDRWKLNLALHYTRGDGYYEQLKTGQKPYKYKLEPGDKVDLVRRKQMANNFYGAVGSLQYDNRNGLQLIIGGGWNKYDGDHYGRVIKVGDKEITDDRAPYYDNNGKKTDGNVYAKLSYEFIDGLSAYVDLQYRHVRYWMTGSSQEYDDNGQVMFDLDKKYNFFNPKVGLNYAFGIGHNVYASFGIAHKEPTRNNFEDMLAEADAVEPQQERLNDLEVGYRWLGDRFQLGINCYYMDYDNQFVLTGAQDSNGEMVARNIKDSYRMGIEVSAGWQPFAGFDWDFNATLSRNRARNMILTLINPDWSIEYANVGTTKLAFSPSVILGNTFSYEYKGARIALMSKYVSRQRLTNSGFDRYVNADGTGTTSAVIDGAFVNDLDLSYTFSYKSLKSVTLGLTLYNLFSEKYDSNGSCSMNFKRENGEVVAYDGGWAWATFSPQAPFHLLARVQLRF